MKTNMDKILTIYVIVEEKELFYANNKDSLDDVRKIQGLGLEIVELTEEDYKIYQELLAVTDSKYIVFYNEYNNLSPEVGKRLVRFLKDRDDKVLIRKMAGKEKRGVGIYQTGGLDSNALYFNRYVFKTDDLKSVCIQKNEQAFFKDKIILEMTKDSEEITLLNEMPIQTEEPLERNVNSYGKQFEYEWYIPYFRQFLLPYVRNGNLTPTEQRLIVYFVMLRFYLNLNSRDKFVLQGDQIDEFFCLVREVTNYIDDEYLIEVRKRGLLPKFFSYLLLKEKYQKKPDFEVKKTAEGFFYTVNGKEYDIDCVVSRIMAINYMNEQLIIDGEIVGDCCLSDVERDFKVLVNDKSVTWERTERYNIAHAFGRSIYRYCPFQFAIPKSEISGRLIVRFVAMNQNIEIKIPIQFEKVSSRLNRSYWSYYRFADQIITYSRERLIIEKAKGSSVAIRELGILTKIFRRYKRKSEALNSMGLRICYWITKNKYADKPVWIFYDKLYKAGDNGEYLFRYCMENHPEADSFYIVNKDAIDYPRLKKEFGRHILEFQSVRQKLTVLNAEIIFATHAFVFSYCGFSKGKWEFKNLLNARIVCIQHGLTIQNIAQYQNRLVDNTRLYFCASKYEIDNLRRPVYGYQRQELCLTGSPRYDGLINRDQRQILIAPTWRRNIVITGNKMGTAKSYNPEFKHTKYFEIYNHLINDERLISLAKEYHYKILFLIHPTLSSQVDDYDKNDYLSIIPAISDISYEKILTESSLMLTDYSGIQFDFAYMKKPVLYYQPKELPPQYTEGVYKYEEMGFGPVIEEYDVIVDTLCEYMKNGCRMKKKYVERVEDFFAYTDHSNCRRIMGIIKEWENQI